MKTVLTNILNNLIDVANVVTTLEDVNDLDRALAALEMRFDITKDQVTPLHAAFTHAQERICPPSPLPPLPMVDKNTEFAVLRLTPSGVWRLYEEEDHWANAVQTKLIADKENPHSRHQIVMFCNLPTKA